VPAFAVREAPAFPVDCFIAGLSLVGFLQDESRESVDDGAMITSFDWQCRKPGTPLKPLE
jgi:hypothetical protein